ncbi:MAG TPA: 16S rRNA (cytosine(967)-C(5))-methyltransferase RsmB [Epulopiscium sp.]|nr:16S rRNA (cytosine(967)-C(5))-methyltransferase RsmB [Candidatus Epulonipiscium sp.]
MAEKNARQIVVEILQEIDREGAYANVALKKALDEHEDLISKDKNLITEITNGTVKYKRRIDYVINQFAKIPINKMKPIIRHVLRMSVYQILFLDKIPESAVCNEAVKIVKKRKMGNLSGVVNGILRNVVRGQETISYPDKTTHPEEYLGIMYSFPDWLIKFWLKEYSFEFVETLCQSLNRTPDVSIRTNTLLISKKDLKESLEKDGIRSEVGRLANEALRVKGITSVATLAAFQKGYFTVQDESSMLVSYVLDPQKGEEILDVCAAPGGKSTHIAELMGNEGTIMSADVYEHKLEMIKESAIRMKHPIIHTILQDATKKNAAYTEKFDRVLIDAPCSGLGLLHKKSDIRWNKEYKDITELVKIQKEILKTCSPYVKPGGIMVYSTCTISSAENSQMALWITQNLDFELESIDSYIPASLRNEDSKEGMIQIFPQDGDSDGFFISRFRKRG